MKVLNALLFIALVAFNIGCNNKSDNSNSPEPSAVSVDFTFVPKVNGNSLGLDQWFVNNSQDSIRLRAWAFYVSNVRFIDTISNTTWSEQDSYHLVLFGSAQLGKTVSLKSPQKGFKVHKIQLSIGIDSVANSSTAFLGKGDLVLGNGMDWNWTDGWKFHLIEGQYRRHATRQNGNFVYHIGFNQHYRTLTYKLSASQSASLESGKYEWRFEVDPREIWGGSTPIDVSFINDEMGRSASATAIANNYATQQFLKLVSLQR